MTTGTCGRISAFCATAVVVTKTTRPIVRMVADFITHLLNERLYFRRAGALTQQHADRGRCCTVSVTGDRRRRTEVPFALPCAPNQSDVRKSALTKSVSTGCDLSKLWSAAWVGALLQLPNAACLERGGSHHRSYSAGKEGRTQGRVARLARYISGSL